VNRNPFDNLYDEPGAGGRGGLVRKARTIQEEDFSNAGGTIQLDAAGTTAKVREKLMNLKLSQPHPIVVMMQSDFTGTDPGNATNQQLVATVNWSVARGNGSALVDIGRGTVFSISAGQLLDITVGFISNNDATAMIAGQPMVVTGTCAPGATSSMRPTFTRQSPSLAQGVESSLIAIPNCATELKLVSQNPDLLPSVLVKFHTHSTTSMVNIQSAGQDWMPVPADCYFVSLLSTTLTAQRTTMVWRLSL
jgi:hypothetical protein